MNTKNISSLIFLFLCTSCVKEVIVEVPVEVSPSFAWTEISSFNGNQRRQLNAFSLNDSMITFRNDGLYTVFNANQLRAETSYIFRSSFRGRPPLNSAFLMDFTADKKSCIFTATSRPVFSGSRSILTGANYDPEFIEFVEPFINFNEFPASINNRFVLLPYKSESSDSFTSYCFLVELKLETEQSLFGRYDIEDVKKITIKTDDNTILNLGNVNVTEDYFFTSYGPITFRIDTLGNIVELPSPIASMNDMFRLGNILFGVNLNGIFYSSPDGGLNWDIFANTGNPLFGFIGFEQIGEEVFGFYRDQIWQFQLSNTNNLTIQELNNEGLERTTIRAIERCGSRIFVCTEFGTFYRNWEDFKEPKDQ